jgi:hypothetical protein
MRWIWNTGVSSAMVGHGVKARFRMAAAGRNRGLSPAGMTPSARPPVGGVRSPSSGSRPPRWSSAMRSSQPPTWVSPMKICGTVRRPVSSHHAVALGGVEVDADLLDLRHAPLLEQHFGAHAVRADLRGVHADGVMASLWPAAEKRLPRSCTAVPQGRKPTSRPAGWRRARRAVAAGQRHRLLVAGLAQGRPRRGWSAHPEAHITITGRPCSTAGLGAVELPSGTLRAPTGGRRRIRPARRRRSARPSRG